MVLASQSRSSDAGYVAAAPLRFTGGNGDVSGEAYALASAVAAPAPYR